MRHRAPKSGSLDLHKAQATRLREFLGDAGITIKHTNALEAVARMHGFPNYHLLQHSAAAREATWVVSTITAGVLPIMHVAHTRADAIALFCHQLARVAADESVEIEVRAQEGGAHVGLYALNYGAIVVALTQPHAPDVAPRGELAQFEEWALTDIAYVLNDAVYERSGWDPFQEKVHDEAFQQTIVRGIDTDVVRGASQSPTEVSADDRVRLAASYLMGVALAPRAGETRP
jgi:hypothetical protein